MPPGRFTRRRRTASQALADERTAELAAAMGRALKEARLAGGFRQAQAAAAAGIAQSTWSAMERGRGASLSWRVWMRATHALGSDLHTYLERTSAASRPRDAVHLRHQELVAGMAASGGWTVRPEAESGSGFADLLLERTSATGVGEVCLVEVWDWLPDVGDAFRSWQRKLAHLEARVRAGANEDRAARLGGAWCCARPAETVLWCVIIRRSSAPSSQATRERGLRRSWIPRVLCLQLLFSSG